MRLFEADDYELICEWFENRGMKSPSFMDLPRIGFIEDYYAAGFLIQTDTPIAIIDFLVSNPNSSSRGIYSAIHAVVASLINEARRRGFKYIKGDSKIRSIEKLAKEFRLRNIGEFKTFQREI